MHIHIYIYMHMCVCVCIYIYAYVYVCVYIHSSVYQASNRRKLMPPEIDKYEEQQHRIIRDNKGKKEQQEMRTRDADHAVLRDKGTSILVDLVLATPGGGGAERVGKGVGAQRDVVLECIVCFEKSTHAVFAPCGHRFVLFFYFFFQRRSVRKKSLKSRLTFCRCVGLRRNLCLNCASKLFEPERVSATCPTCRQRIERVLTADISS
jgi:hypothetical protein